MKPRFLGLLLLCTSLAPSVASAGKAEADFNDLKLGDTRTRGDVNSPNDNILNTGSGFLAATGEASGGNGEYNNNTGVLKFERGDLPVPAGTIGYTSVQGSPIDAAAAGPGGGVVFTSGTETGSNSNQYTRFQERQLATALKGASTGGVVWFSYLFRLDGPQAQGQLVFNSPATQNSSDFQATGTDIGGAFGISLGHRDTPGAFALNLNPTQTPADIVGAGSDLIYYDGTKGVEVRNPAAITSHLVIGRVVVNATGNDLIEIWLDPANVNSLGTPTLTSNTDEIGSTGIFSVAFEGTRFIAPTPTSGPYTNGGHFAMDHFRISDEADGFEFVTGNVAVDPKLIISPTSPSSSFNFRGVYGSGDPITSGELVVTLKNDGATQDITINSIGFSNTTNTTFSLIDPPATPFDLEPGQEVSLRMQAASSTLGVQTSNTLVIDTNVDEQDMILGASATFFSNGSRLNRNSGFETNLDYWTSDSYGLDDTPPLRVTPGFLGTGAMLRMQGVDDARGTDNISQTVLNGAADWEFSFVFSPINEADFAAYAGSALQAGDRTFQVVIQADSNIPTPAAGTQGTFTEVTNADAALVNLAYLPLQGGFCVFNGTSWVSLGLPAITGSTDATRNGNLSATDPAGADTVNAYVVRIKGTGFGTPSAKYSVSVSNPNSAVTNATASNITIFSAAQGSTNTPGAYTFTTGDVSSSGTVSGSPIRTTTYWIDEVSFFAGQARNPDISIGGNPSVVSHNGVVTPALITVTNVGESANLEISDLYFGKPLAFSTTSTPTIVIPPGVTTTIPVSVDPAGFTGSNNVEFTNLNLVTNVTQQPNYAVQISGTATSDANLLANWNFEIYGNDHWSDWDTFLSWDEYGVVTQSKDVPGLVAGSGNGVHIANTAAIRNTLAASPSDFVVESYFAVRNSADRAFNLVLEAADRDPVLFLLNLRYQGNRWEAYSGTWQTVIDMTSNPLATSNDANGDSDLEDAGDTKAVYKLRVTAQGWKSATPTYQIEILDVAGNPVAASAPGLAIFQTLPPPEGPNRITFAANTGTNAGFWLDDVLIYSTVESEGVTITSISKGTGTFTLNWDSGGQPVTIERSTTMEATDWNPVSENNTAGPFTDNAAPNGRAFYRVRLANP